MARIDFACVDVTRSGCVFRRAGLVGRRGGDEFAIVLQAPRRRGGLAEVLRQTIAMPQPSLFWNGHHVEVSASIGAALIGRPHHHRILGLFAETDAALYQAKAAGQNCVHVSGD